MTPEIDPRLPSVTRAIRKPIRDGIWNEHTPLREFAALAREALAAADAMDPLRRPGHIAHFQVKRFSLQHPPECRPDLLSCPVDNALQALESAPVDHLGRYHVELDQDGKINVLGRSDS